MFRQQDIKYKRCTIHAVGGNIVNLWWIYKLIGNNVNKTNDNQ